MQEMLIQLALGAVGGNGAAAVLKKFDLGLVGNTVAGLVGGGIGGQILNQVMGAGAPAGMVGDVASGGIGGAVVMILVGVVKQMLAKKA